MTAPTFARGDVLAHLDAVTGVGWLMLPARLADDAVSAFADAAVSELVGALQGHGWDMLDNETGSGPLTEGWCPDGRLAVALFARDAVIDSPSFEQIREAATGLAGEAGVWL